MNRLAGNRLLGLGEPAPWFHAQALDGNPRYAFNTVAGRWVLLFFAGSAGREETGAALRLIERERALFNDERACFFGVTIDQGDVAEGRIAQALPGIRWLLDYDRNVSTMYGAAADGGTTYRPHWLLLDPMLRVHARAAIGDGEAMLDELRHLVALPLATPPAPVLVLPGILPPDLCRRLIALHDDNGGKESGFMREENGITVEKSDHSHKRRVDYTIEDEQLIGTLKGLISQTLSPMVLRAFQFEATRIERFIIACYDAADGGHFRAHRDNTTKAPRIANSPARST